MSDSGPEFGVDSASDYVFECEDCEEEFPAVHVVMIPGKPGRDEWVSGAASLECGHGIDPGRSIVLSKADIEELRQERPGFLDVHHDRWDVSDALDGILYPEMPLDSADSSRT